MKKNTTLKERVVDSAKGVNYRAKNVVLNIVKKRIERKEENISHLDKEQKKISDSIKRDHPTESQGTLWNIEIQDNKYSKIRERSYKQKVRLTSLRETQTSLTEKIDTDSSSIAAYKRLSDTSYIYDSVSELLADRVLVEKFRPNGKSSFDFKIDVGRVSSIEDKDAVENLLTPTDKSSTYDKETISTIFSFADARLLGEERYRDCFSIPNYGLDLQRRITEIRKENTATIKSTAKTGEDMKAYLAEDKELAELESIADLMTTSAVEYYENMMEEIPKIK